MPNDYTFQGELRRGVAKLWHTPWKVKVPVAGAGAVLLIGSLGGGGDDGRAVEQSPLAEETATAVVDSVPTQVPTPVPTELPPTPTEVPPTETPVPPTATPIPPTNTPEPPTPTPIPPTPIPPTPTPVPPTATAAPQCDENYAGACIPIVSYDLDCGDIGARRFRVVGFDHHRFDGDHDGIGCES